jgi:Bax protein
MAHNHQASWLQVLAALLLCALILLLWWPGRERSQQFGPPPDFSSIGDVTAMKAAFYDYLTPIIHHHNANALRQRHRLQDVDARLAAGDGIDSFNRRWLRELAVEYEIDWQDEPEVELVKRLLRRVDIVPLELALVQAAKESGWGRSRFAVSANNYFGQWCYDPGCGIVPANRRAGGKHEVQRFESVSEAIRRYMNNLNSHERYAALRGIRAKLRASGKAVTGMALAEGLTFYSERRQDYVSEVQAMIRRYLKYQSRTLQ